MERRKALGCILGSAALVATAGKATAAEATPPKFKPWIGDFDRSKIDWKPAIDSKICGGCGMCMNCGAKVYDWVNKRPAVARPEKCMVGCTTCMNMCPRGAISLPPIADVKKMLKVEKLYVRIKDILKEQGRIPQDG